MKPKPFFLILCVLLAAQLACNLPEVVPTGAAPVSTGGAPFPVIVTEAVETEGFEPTQEIPPVAAPAAAVQLNVDLFENFSYWVEDFNMHAPLQNGKFYEGETQIDLVKPVGLGDLNGDGQEDAAVILRVDPSGSGSFTYLIALVNQNGVPVQQGSGYIGDRQGILNLEITDGLIVLNYVTQGPDDPLCCASQHRLRTYRLENGVLQIATEQVLDRP